MTTFYRRHGKRLLDLALTIPALIVFAPVMGAAALAVRLAMGRPLLFAQQRPGLHGEPFTLYKFRTMDHTRDAAGNLLSDDQRLTPLGRFLRNTSVDELPELWNILRADMSIVGPRPLLVRYLDRYSLDQARRHEVKPGLTGWAQVHGRNALGWEQKLALDVWYVDHLNLWLDIKIIAMTIWKTLAREGTSPRGQATMEEFHDRSPR